MEIKRVWLANLTAERKRTRETVAAIAGHDLSYRPTPEQRRFGDQVLHVIAVQQALLGALRGEGWNWGASEAEAPLPELAEILRRFDQMHAAELAYYEGLDEADFGRPVTLFGQSEPMLYWLLDFLAHETHHRGQMVVYLRLLGIAAPRY